MVRILGRLLLGLYQAMVAYRIHSEQTRRHIRWLRLGSVLLLAVCIVLLVVGIHLGLSGWWWLHRLVLGWLGLAALGAAGLVFALRELRIDRMMRGNRSQREIFVLDWPLFLLSLGLGGLAVCGILAGAAELPSLFRGVSEQADRLEPVWTEPVKGDFRGVAFGPGGELLASGPSGILAWNPDTRQPQPGPFAVPLSESTGELTQLDPVMHLRTETAELRVTKDAKEVEVRRKTGGAHGEPRWEALVGHEAPVTCIALASDGKLALSGSKDGTVRVWDLTTGQPRWCLREAEPFQVVLSGDGRVALSASYEQGVRAWDLATGQPRSSWHKPPQRPEQAGLSPDGRLAVILTREPRQVASGQPVVVWDTNTGQQVRSTRLRGSFLHHVTVSSDGGRVLTAGLDGIQLWNLP